MIIDTSAMVAIFTRESGSFELANALFRADERRMSSVNLLESFLVLDRKGDAVWREEYDHFVDEALTEIVAFTPEHTLLARAAYSTFGKGSGHRARLNFGDCCAYSLAKETGEPLLFKGDDFSHTDIVPAT